MSDTLTLPDGLVVPSRGHAADCDVFFAPARGCSCAVAREIRMTRERDALRTRLAEVTREREDALLDVAGSEAEDAAAIAAAERRGAQAMREHCAVAINGRCNQATMLDQRNAVEFLALGLSDIRALPLPGDEQAGEKA